MVEKTLRPNEPRGEPARHLSLAALESGLCALPVASQAEGRVTLIVRRLADGARETLERARLTRAEGLLGDDWSRRPPSDPEAQLAVMYSPVAQLIANGQPLTAFGDNLFVDLDLSAANLPTATRIRIGEAVVAVTPLPHDGCSKFNARFGADALRFVQARRTRERNLRGIYLKVVEPGEVWRGAAVKVVARGGSAPV